MMKRISRILLIVLAIVFVIPVILTVVGSLMSPGEVLARFGENTYLWGRDRGLTFIPDVVSLRQFYELFVENMKYMGMFWNSIFYTILIVALSNIIIIPSAFVFAKIKFKFSNALFITYIIAMMMPFQVTLLPNYIALSQIGLLNTMWALILPSMFAPMGVFLLRQFIYTMPNEYIEAASLESNSIINILVRVVIPNVKSGIIAMNILIFAEAWNMVEQPLVFLNDQTKWPLSTAMNSIISADVSISFSGAMIFLAPVIVLYICFDEHILKGMESFIW